MSDPIDAAALRAAAIKKLHERFEAAVLQQINEFDSDAIVAEIVKELNAAKREITLRVLGMQKAGRTWHVDHREGSPLADFIKTECAEQLAAWVKPAVAARIKEMQEKNPDMIAKAVKDAVADSMTSWEVDRVIGAQVKEITKDALNTFAKQLKETARKD